jgi:hypothetical protein
MLDRGALRVRLPYPPARRPAGAIPTATNHTGLKPRRRYTSSRSFLQPTVRTPAPDYGRSDYGTPQQEQPRKGTPRKHAKRHEGEGAAVPTKKNGSLRGAGESPGGCASLLPHSLVLYAYVQ